jgi:Rieske Fe-S protein
MQRVSFGDSGYHVTPIRDTTPLHENVLMARLRPEFLKNMSASADVLAMAKVEVDLNAIPEGKNVIIKWRGKPVFIRHRTAEEIDEANKVNVASLRDPQTDDDRVQKPEWLVMLGTICFVLFLAQCHSTDCAAGPSKHLRYVLLTTSI